MIRQLFSCLRAKQFPSLTGNLNVAYFQKYNTEEMRCSFHNDGYWNEALLELKLGYLDRVDEVLGNLYQNGSSQCDLKTPCTNNAGFLKTSELHVAGNEED